MASKVIQQTYQNDDLEKSFKGSQLNITELIQACWPSKVIGAEDLSKRIQEQFLDQSETESLHNLA